MSTSPGTLDPSLPKNYRLVYEVAHARERQPSIGFTTIYRGLARLRNLKLISDILLPGADSAYYEPLVDSHAHFRCDACGTVLDIDYRPAKSIAKGIGKAHNVDVDELQVSFHGRCSAWR